MHVIQFPSWRIWFYEDEGKHNAISRWLDDNGASESDRVAFQVLLDICKLSGPDALSYCTIDLGGGFYGIRNQPKGALGWCAVYHRETFSDSEITFLAAALLVKKQLKPRYVKGIAEERLDALRERPERRRYERIYWGT